MTTIYAHAQLLADAARVLAAREALEPLLERSADAPVGPRAVRRLPARVDDSCPRAAAALDRLCTSGAVAMHPPGPSAPLSSSSQRLHRRHR